MQSSSATVVGLGRVGLSFAGFLASRGVRVKGVDTNPGRVQTLLTGTVASNEPRVAEVFAANRGQIELTDLAAGVESTDFTFVVVPTPSRPDGTLSDGIVRDVVRDAAVVAGKRSTKHVITVVSTLLPGSTRAVLAPLVATGPQQCALLCYSPVFVALGSVLDCLERPPFVLVGADDAEAGERLAAFYEGIGYDRSLLVRAGTIDAEIAKLSLNAFLTTKIAFANALAELCGGIVGSDVDAVLGIIARDPRVGAGCLRAGTPFGGPCLPRDTEALIALAAQRQVRPLLMNAVKASNDQWYHSLRDRVLARTPQPGAIIGVIGLTYKPKTDFLEEGFGLRLAQDLAGRGYTVLAHDDGLHAGHRPSFPGFTIIDDLEDVIRRADVCVVTCLDDALSHRVAGLAPPGSVLDLWHSGRTTRAGTEARAPSPSRVRAAGGRGEP